MGLNCTASHMDNQAFCMEGMSKLISLDPKFKSPRLLETINKMPQYTNEQTKHNKIHQANYAKYNLNLVGQGLR